MVRDAPGCTFMAELSCTTTEGLAFAGATVGAPDLEALYAGAEHGSGGEDGTGYAEGGQAQLELLPRKPRKLRKPNDAPRCQAGDGVGALTRWRHVAVSPLPAHCTQHR